jgi:DNA-binding response OmpR family regulator
MGLPGGPNGRQVADAGRALRPSLKVLFITGYSEKAVIGDNSLDDGMTIMTKPFPMEDLAVRIRGMI